MMNKHALALKAISYLVPRAKGRANPVPYSQMAKYLDINPRAVGQVLGYMRDNLLGDQYPLLNALVVYKKTRLPGRGWLGSRPKNLSDEMERQLFIDELEKIYSFKGWDQLLHGLGLTGEKLKENDLLRLADRYIDRVKTLGERGEGKWHKALKEYIGEHPDLLGLPPTAKPFLERRLKSGDEADLIFHIGNNRWAIIEVKQGVDVGELVKGIFQAVKYRALLEAEEKVLGKKPLISTFLVSYNNIRDVEVLAVRLSVQCMGFTKSEVSKWLRKGEA